MGYGGNSNSLGVSVGVPSTNPVFNSIASNESASLGAELTSSTGWTSTGWSGSYGAGFTNNASNTQPLTFALTNTGTNLYQVSLTVTSPTGNSDFTVSLGNSVGYVMYKGAIANQAFTYTCGIQSVSNGNLVITPGSDFDGTITNISVKQITGTTNPTQTIKDSTNSNSVEIRSTTASLDSLFIGVNSGRYNTTGDNNISLGDTSMSMNTSGYWNTALGNNALQNNTVGSRNVALGYLALQDNISGDRNIGIGTYALNRNTTGRENIALGADSLWYNTSGSFNMAMGTASLAANTTGTDNVGIGTAALTSNTTGQYNIAIGTDAMQSNVSSNNNVAIGYASQNYSTASPNTAVGYMAQYHNTTGTNNAAFGDNTLLQNTTGVRNTAIGSGAGAGAAGAAFNRTVLVGYNAGTALTTGADFNVIIGASSGSNLTTGASNILIGYNIQATSATTSNSLNIGNTIYGDISTGQRIGIGVQSPTAHMHLKAGAATAGMASLKIDAGTLLSAPEAGAIEFDGTNLYFTTSGGVRKTITAA